jgi:hypothetical protein
LKLKFELTPHNSIRVWMIDDSSIDVIRERDEFKLFQLLSIWNGYDIIESDKNSWIHAWELPLSLTDFILDRFRNRNNCEIKLGK